MLYLFPSATLGIVRRKYDRPYDDPISVEKGEIVHPVADGSMETDFLGWTWCTGSDGRSGWVPDSWCEVTDAGWRLLRDFSALEFSVDVGERLQLILGESGFVFARRATGETAWVPDAVLELDHSTAG